MTYPLNARLSKADLPAPDLTTPPWPAEEVAVGRNLLTVRHTPATSPDAEPALFVHGLGGASTNWTDLAHVLAGHLDADAIDLPGFGWSKPSPTGDYSMREQSRVVIRFLEQRGRGPVHLFGNSMGGAISMFVAANRPDLVRSLTLISPAVRDLKPRKMDSGRAVMPLLVLPGAERAAIRRLNGVSPESRVRGTIELCYGDPSTVPPARMAEAAEDARKRAELPWATPVLVRSLRGLAASYVPGPRSLWSAAGRITAPTLVVWGDRDKLVNVGVAARTARLVRGARLLVLPGVGHVAQMEDPESTARAWLALIEDQMSGVTSGDRGNTPGQAAEL